MSRHPSRKPDLVDLHVYGGALSLAAGFWMLAPWAGAVALGLVLMALGLGRA